ncbi:hypothetical protein C8R32_106220 [Nitrosospira sp. Nsp5]|nr:hypothetical protein C8R32_106220 [Nitrosospira sp. Nsp5]
MPDYLTPGIQAVHIYIHINPIRHGLVRWVSEWPYPTFHRLVEKSVYPADWAGGDEDRLEYEDKHTAQCASLIDTLPFRCRSDCLSESYPDVQRSAARYQAPQGFLIFLRSLGENIRG